MLFLPVRGEWRELWVVLIAFVAFRFFDILKPPPCRQLEKLPAGWGILMDDLMAGVYANLASQLVIRFLLGP
jgi:phosphatidylglycerophosphatase A